MDIGTKFKVLMCANVDAIDDGTDPIEIKTKKRKHWGTEVLFQMISSGTTAVCYRCKVKNNVLTNITMRLLQPMLYAISVVRL